MADSLYYRFHLAIMSTDHFLYHHMVLLLLVQKEQFLLIISLIISFLVQIGTNACYILNSALFSFFNFTLQMYVCRTLYFLFI